MVCVRVSKRNSSLSLVLGLVSKHNSSLWLVSIRDELFKAKSERRQVDRKWRNIMLTIPKHLYKHTKHIFATFVNTTKCQIYTVK